MAAQVLSSSPYVGAKGRSPPAGGTKAQKVRPDTGEMRNIMSDFAKMYQAGRFQARRSDQDSSMDGGSQQAVRSSAESDQSARSAQSLTPLPHVGPSSGRSSQAPSHRGPTKSSRSMAQAAPKAARPARAAAIASHPPKALDNFPELAEMESEFQHVMQKMQEPPEASASSSPTFDKSPPKAQSKWRHNLMPCCSSEFGSSFCKCLALKSKPWGALLGAVRQGRERLVGRPPVQKRLHGYRNHAQMLRVIAVQALFRR